MSLGARSAYGHPLSTGGVRAAHTAATIAALAALLSTDPACAHGNEVLVDADGSQWVFNKNSALAGDNIFVLAPADAPAAGRWIRKAGIARLDLSIPFATADATVLATIPAGFRFRPLEANWKVTTTMTTASAAGAGVSSSNAAASTKGDLLGGATGDVVATLVSTGASNFVLGTGGAKLMGTNTQRRAIALVAGDTLRYDLFTGTFTGGVFAAQIHGIIELAPTV